MLTLENSEDPDEMQHDAAFHQDLHCLSRKIDLKRMKYNFIWKSLQVTLDMYKGPYKFIRGARWLSERGRVLDSRSRGCRFKPQRMHCVVSLSKKIYPLPCTGSIQEDLFRHDSKMLTGT